MPALKEEYDYYEYARRRQGTVKNTVPSSAVHKSTNQTSKRVSDTTKTSRTVQTINLKTSTTRDVTKNATRLAAQDDFLGSKNKVTTKKSNTTNKVSKRKNNLSDDFLLTNKKSTKTYAKPQEMTLKKPKSNVKAKTIAKQKARVKEMFRNFTVASLVFGMFFLICYRYSSINEAFNEVNDMKSNLRKQQTINSQLESTIQANTDLAYIENYAKYQLGMQKPKDSQIQKINVTKKDKITTPIEIKEEKEVGMLETIFNDLLKVLD